MSYKDGVVYDPATTEFTQEQLLQITPSHLKRWMCFVAYGTPDPGFGDYPRRGRSSAIENSKKAISFYTKLSLRFPEKSRYFAALIKELENKLNT